MKQTRQTSLERRLSVDIIIPSYNTLALLQALLLQVKETAPDTLAIVVDNGSTDGTPEWLAEQDMAIPIVNETNLGFAKACNLGAWAGDREIVVFLNTDIELVPGWLEALLAVFADDDVVMAGNQLVKPDDHCQRYDFIAGACCAVRRDWFTEGGGFDEQFFFGYEDVDLSWRARLEGKKIITAAEPTLVHLGASSHTEATKVHVREARELFRRKWDMPILKFVGGGRYLVGVPARDLSVEDLMGIGGWTMGGLAATGLYEKVAKLTTRRKRKATQVKAKTPQVAGAKTTVPPKRFLRESSDSD